MVLSAASSDRLVDTTCAHEMVYQGNFGDANGDFALASRLHVTEAEICRAHHVLLIFCAAPALCTLSSRFYADRQTGEADDVL